MKLTELLLAGLVFWTLLGAAGTAVWLIRGERRRARRAGAWLAVVWVVYIVVLLLVSWRQPERRMGVGEQQCFDDLCFAVAGADEVEGFRARGQEGARLLRVKVRVMNRGKGRPQAEGLIRAYLVDAQGRQWDEVRGLGGVRLTGRVAAGDSVVSEPVFRVARDASGLGLVLTHGRWQPGVLVIGDADSWGHRPTLMMVGR